MPVSLLIATCALLAADPAILDRIAVVVGKRIVKASDVNRNVRLAQFMNNAPLTVNEAERRSVAERLVDQEVIRQEMMSGGYSQPVDREVNVFVQQLVRDRFAGSEAQMQTALTKYGLTKSQFQAYILWQLSVLRFIEQRFRPGVVVTDEDIKSYYDQHLPELRKKYPGNTSLEGLAEAIRDIIGGEKVNQNFDEWLKQSRDRIKIEFRDAAFQEKGKTQ